MSYIQYCCGAILGPCVEFRDFQKLMEFEGHYKDLPRGMDAVATFAPTLWNLGGAIASISVHVGLALAGFSIYFCGSPEYAEYGNFFTRVAFYFIGMTGQKAMYYIPWLLNDAASKASGLAYSGTEVDKKTGEKTHKWDNCVSIYVWKLETGSSCIQMMSYWNHGVHLWLNHHVQARIVEPGKKPVFWQTASVFLTSAFWHGFYPFYYMMFFLAACMVELSKDIFRARALFQWVPYPYIVGNFLTMLALNYLGTCFTCLTLDRGMNFGAGTNYLFYILLPLLAILSKAINLVGMAKKYEKNTEGEKKK
jgi:lysophospholipid acyltransferase